jgi:predicted RND superfamily exporter protein
LEKFFKHPWVIVGGVAAITVFFALQLPKAQMDNNLANFLPRDNPARITTDHLEAEYGDEIIIVVGLERPYGRLFYERETRNVYNDIQTQRKDNLV